MKQFLYLYPIDEVFKKEVYNASSQHGLIGQKKYWKHYGKILNECIDLRYRKNGFQINYVVFNGQEVSSLIAVRPSDRIFEVGIDLQQNNKGIFPDGDYVLNQLGNISSLRLGGFHRTFCVSNIAKHAYEKGIDVLVDEDLTEFLTMRIKDSDFDPRLFNGIGMKKGTWIYQEYVDSRKGKPWLLQPE